MSAAQQLNHYLAYYGRRLNLNLGLKNGVCALVEHQREIAVIELPPDSDCIIFHCKIASLTGTSEPYLRMLLALNFEMDAMRGCWLATDGDEGLRLCTQLPLAGLDADRFSSMLDGFINQVRDVGEFLAENRAVA